MAAFYVCQRLGLEHVVVWLGLALVAVYVAFVSPGFREAPESRIAVFDFLPWVLLPFLHTETNFDSGGWMRILLSARSDRSRIFVAHGVSRLVLALTNACVITAILSVGLHGAISVRLLVHHFATILGFACFMAGLGSLVAQFATGRVAIAANYLAVLVLAYSLVKMPPDVAGVASFVLFPGPLAGLESATLWSSGRPWWAMAGITSSAVWWVLAYRAFSFRNPT